MNPCGLVHEGTCEEAAQAYAHTVTNSEKPRPIIVTMGEYSDYQIVCACPDRETADRIVEALQSTGNYGETSAAVQDDIRWAIEPPIVYEILSIHAGVTEDGETFADQTYSSGDVPSESVYREWCWPDDQLPEQVRVLTYAQVSTLNPDEPGSVRVSVSGADHERVRKVFSEQFAQAKATARLMIEKERVESRRRRRERGVS